MNKKIAMIFSGQGSQVGGMGRCFYDNSELAQKMFLEASTRIGISFKDLIFEDDERLHQSRYAQPAILLVQMIAYKLFKKSCPNVKIELFLGHSLGEFTALCASGAIDFADAIELVYKRGCLMEDVFSSMEAGMMVIVKLDDAKVEAICEEARRNGKKIWPANYNQDGQIVVAGIKSDLHELEETFKEAGAKRAMLLNMSVASHCELLKPAQEPLEELMQSMINDNFEAPIISNVTASPYSTKEEAVKLLKEQLIKPVKYKQSIASISDKIEIAIEFGHGVILKNLNKRIAKDMITLNVSDMATLSEVKEEFFD